MFSRSSSDRGSDRSKRLPVFVFPEDLKFFTNERNRKQILTLYNPYDVTLNFKILSNVPHRYRVVESQGIMKPHCCVDIVIRHLSPDQRDFEEIDEKFRIDFFQGTKLIGRKQVPVKLIEQEIIQDDQEESVEFKDLPLISETSSTKQSLSPLVPEGRSNSGIPGVWTALIGIVSLMILLLPLENESSSWPDWIHVTVSMKLTAAFVLGLVTMVILKS